MTDDLSEPTAAPGAPSLVEISPADPVFAQLVATRHRRYRRSTPGGIEDEILELWQDLRDLGLTIAEKGSTR